MSDAPPLRRFVIEALTDLGATLSDGDSLLWVQAPESVQRDLDVPARFALAFDPERNREFEAELVAPGSYFLERLVSVVTRRGQWNVSQCTISGTDWISEALRECGLGPETPISSRVDGVEDELLLLFAFRVTLISDEKRESFHLVAVSLADGSAWPVDPDRADLGLAPHPSPEIHPDVEAAYRLATESLRTTTGVEVERFRTRSLGLLEEEVRRIFGYFDRTIGTPRIRPGRIPGPAPSGHGGAGSPPHGSRRAVRSEGECVPVFDPRDPGSDGSPRDRVPGWPANRIEARCMVSAAAGYGVQDLRQCRGTVATVFPGWIAVRHVCVYASRVRSTSRPSEVGYSSTRNAGRRSFGAISSRIQGAISRRFRGPSTPMRSFGTR